MNAHPATRLPATVRICGVDYPDCEMIQQGEYCGIKTPAKTFWLFPVCDEGGRPLKSLPPFLPLEIRPVTTRVPDLTQQFQETVQRLYDLARAYFSRVTTLDDYLRDSPTKGLTEAEFHQAREQRLSLSLEEFAKSTEVRFAVWRQHGTQEMANQVGYLGQVWEPRRAVDHKGTSTSSCCPLAEILALGLGGGTASARALVDNLRYVLIYDDTSEALPIYLSGMQESPSPQAPRLEIRTTIVNRDERELTLMFPDLDRLERAIEKGEVVAKTTAQNLEAAAAQERERTTQAVTRIQVCAALGVGERQVKNILKREGLTAWPATQGELDDLLGRQRVYEVKLSASRARRNRRRKRSGPPVAPTAPE